MDIDLRTKSQQLLETISNCIFDRENGNVNQHPINFPAFTINEVNAVEEWLYNFVNEITKGVEK